MKESREKVGVKEEKIRHRKTEKEPEREFKNGGDETVMLTEGEREREEEEDADVKQ